MNSHGFCTRKSRRLLARVGIWPFDVPRRVVHMGSHVCKWVSVSDDQKRFVWYHLWSLNTRNHWLIELLLVDCATRGCKFFISSSIFAHLSSGWCTSFQARAPRPRPRIVHAAEFAAGPPLDVVYLHRGSAFHGSTTRLLRVRSYVGRRQMILFPRLHRHSHFQWSAFPLFSE